MSETTCRECGASSPELAVFCASCGARVGAATCQCGARIPPEAAFCPACGGEVEGHAAGEMGRRARGRPDAGIRWVRREHKVATRIAPSDLLGRLRSGLEVQPGTRALLFLGGRYVGTLAPGRHTVEGLFQKLKIPTDGEPVAIVVDDGELSLELEVDGLHSADHHNVDLFAQASLRLAEAEVFLANVLRDRATYTVDDLTAFLADEIRQSLRELLAEQKADDLYLGRTRGALEMELLSRWKPTLDRTGFVLNRFRVLRFVLPGLEEGEDVRSDAGDALTVRAARRETREATYFEADLAEFNLDTLILDRREGAAEDRRRVEVEHEVERTRIDAERLERRQPVLERLLQGGVLEKMSELKSGEEWRRFRLQVDRDRLLDEHQWQELRKDTQAKGEETEVNRQYLLRRVQLIHQADHQELELLRAYQLKLLEMRGDTQVVEEQVRQERVKLDADLANRRQVFDRQLEERERWFEVEVAQRARAFEQQITEEGRRLELQRQEREQQLWTVERLETIRQMGKDREAARQLQLDVTRAEAERKRLGQLGEMTLGRSAQEIIATSVLVSPEAASGAADAMRALQGDQLLARERELQEQRVAELREDRRRQEALDHDKFKVSTETSAEHRADYRTLDEREKDREERVSTAAVTRGLGGPSAQVETSVYRQGRPGADDAWLYCERHDLKYRAGRECPDCARERSAG